MQRFLFGLLLCAGVAWAGPEDPSRFDGAALGSQKAVFQFNLERPEDLYQAPGYMTNHLSGLQEFDGIKKSHIVVVAHGNEMHMLSRLNPAAYPDVYECLKVLADQRVTFRVSRNAANLRGYKPGDFDDEVTAARAGRDDRYRPAAATGLSVHFRGSHQPDQAARVSAEAPRISGVSGT